MTDAAFHQLTLENGLEVIAELHPAMKSVAAGFFVRTGSRDEAAVVSGVSHFLEHMAFKGRGELDADEINRRFDELGASYNASTSEETTIYYAAVLPEYLGETFELLATLLRPDLRQEDFDLEKQVILEEIGMYDDQPAFLAYEKLMQAHFGSHPLGMSILGSTESITDLARDRMADYHARRYGAENVVLCVAGSAEWDTVRSLAEQHCGDWQPGERQRSVREAESSGGTSITHRPDQFLQTVDWAATAPPADHPLRIAAELVSICVGDDAGSRLYWELVDPGEAESAELSFNEYDGAGVWMTGLGCLPDRVAGCRSKIDVVFDEVNRHGVGEGELERAKNKLCSRLVLSGERPMGRLGSLGSHWLYRGRYVSVDEELSDVRAVTEAHIRELLENYPLRRQAAAAVGPLDTLPE